MIKRLSELVDEVKREGTKNLVVATYDRSGRKRCKRMWKDWKCLFQNWLQEKLNPVFSHQEEIVRSKLKINIRRFDEKKFFYFRIRY